MKLNVSLTILAAAALAFGLEPGDNENPWGIKAGGWFGMTIHRITRSSVIPNIESDEPYLNGAWIQSFNGGISLSTDIGAHFTINSGISGNVGAVIQNRALNQSTNSRSGSARLGSANFVVRIGNPDNPRVTAKLGFFGYNYTKGTRDFGGYLYTAGLHPAYLSSSAGGAGIAGLLLTTTLPASLAHDLIVNFETDRGPYLDMSLGYVATINPSPAINLGVGAKLHRILPAADRKNEKDLIETVYKTETILGYDTTVHEGTTTISPIYDSTTVPFGGVKLMARGFVDFKKAFGISSSFFKEDDLQLFGEVALLGIKDYPLSSQGLGYTEIKDRMVYSAGVTLPTHPIVATGIVPALASLFLIGIERDSVWYRDSLRIVPVETTFDTTVLELREAEPRGFKHKKARPYIWLASSVVSGLATTLLEKAVGERMRLDVLAVEAEYCSSPYKNNHNSNETALPDVIDEDVKKIYGEKDAKGWHFDDWRWAIIAKKTFVERVSVSFKMASDHIRIQDPSSGFYQFDQKLVGYDEWYWELGLGLSF